MPRPCSTHGAGRPHPGFTIIEVLIVVVLIGIVSAMAYGGWKRVMWRVHALGAVDEFRGALMLARSDATTRQRFSGVLLDLPGRRYLRFVDSTTGDVHDGRYSVGERVIQSWTELPQHMVVYTMNSSLAAPPTVRSCGVAAVSTPATPQAALYSLVFTPEGRSMATFRVRFGIESRPGDTLGLDILPATGLVLMER